ncbi:hemolysin-III related-domain-containing protein [Microdochium trichocladiopsis]|uniref:Hemolysin-III related-domain-containing protein n=1 Tax=Microdochium trichocladiopsis TaxID=1682393 RepID=A0A9P8XSP0_9PEZI|nr:hemolysin-III related-domain-containing protein [Microdochium trichocladiopsis]KAH7009372.1 hemolysin-III related-domain-containing protein [Microdochium trichocladiopsis]
MSPTRTADHIQGQLSPKSLMLYHAIPSWQQDNEFLLSGYRPISGSLYVSLRSILYMDNETVNIVSHMSGCIAFTTIPFFLHHMHHPTISHYCFGVAFCFALVIQPGPVTLSNHSRSWAQSCNRLDYLGIVVLVWSANAPMVLSDCPASRTCRDSTARLYAILISSSVVFIFGHNFGFSAFRKWRVLVYSISGLGSLASLLHSLQIKGWAVLVNHLSLGWLACTMSLNLIAAAVYASRIPERWFPYRFDLVGASHQIFHLLVLIATFTHLAGLLATSQYASR